MKYSLVKNVVGLLEDFEGSNTKNDYLNDLSGFKKWIVDNYSNSKDVDIDVTWEGKDKGRTIDSAISTLIVHMNRFAKNYSKAAILESEFTTQEDFIYLINLKAFGEMTKMELIKKNVHDKPIGILIINRLMSKGWVHQKESKLDKRSKIIGITDVGLEVLERQMQRIRTATSIVTGNLSNREKMELLSLLNKLSDFHVGIYEKNINIENLLEEATMLKN